MRSLLPALLVLLSAASTGSAQDTRFGTWRLRAAVVLDGLDVKPVPLHALRLVSSRDSTLAFEARTDLDGRAEGRAPAGEYLLQSVAPLRVGGVAWSWSLPVELQPGAVAEVQFTNMNARIDSTLASEFAASGRRVEDAVTAYRRVRGSVFRIEAGLVHGSGFLVDREVGLVVTNAHVVSDQTQAFVVIDSVTRVASTVLARDESGDIAVLRVNPAIVNRLEPLPLADPKATSTIVEPGERLFAIGYPLSQEQTLTTGIASSIRGGAIISDVNINPGNSGGPMLNYGGIVVGVNTFGEAAQVGSGIGGAVVATRVWPVLETARLALDGSTPPPERLLPTMPLTAMTLTQVQAIGDTADLRRLRRYESEDVGAFDVTLNTPVQLYLAQRKYDDEIGRDRRKREANAGVAPEQRYSSLKVFREWMQYVGNPLAPVVQVVVDPKIGETFGSALGRAFVAGLAGVATKGTYKFRGDVRHMTLYRNGVPVEPMRGGSTPVEVYVDNQWISLKDVANRGLYIYSPLAFTPDSMGTPPSIVIVVEDLKKPKDPKCRELRREAVANVWNDFLGWVREAHPDHPAVPANPKADPKMFTSSGVAGDSVVTLEPRRTWKLTFPSCSEFGY